MLTPLKSLKLLKITVLIFSLTFNSAAYANDPVIEKPQPPVQPSNPNPTPVGGGNLGDILQRGGDGRDTSGGVRPPMLPQTGGGTADQSRSEGRQRFQGESSPSCPFQEPSPSTAALIARVQGALRTLKNESAQCAQVQRLAEEAATSLEGLSRDQSQEVFSSESSEMNCTNYEARLRRQFDLAIAESASKTVNFGTSPYAECTSDSRGFAACAEALYVEQISQQVERCGYVSRNRENQQIRQSLENLTQITTQMIEGAGSCSPQTAQAVVQTAIAQATATASMSAGFGLVGLGVSLAGRLLSSVATRIFSNGGPERFLRDIGNDVSRPSRFCLFYDVQKAALGCESAIYNEVRTVQGAVNPDLCEDQQNAVINLIRSSDSIRTQLAAQAAASPQGDSAEEGRAPAARGPAPIQNLDGRTRDFIESLNRPVGRTGKKYIDILRDMQASFAANRDSVIDRNYASELARALRLYDELNGSNDTSLDGNALTAKTLELTNILMGQPTTAGGAVGVLDLPDALQRYYTSPGRGGGGSATVADTLNQSRTIAEVIRQSNRESEMARDIIRSNGDQLITDRLLSALVSTNGFRNEFTDRLKFLESEYQAYRNRESDPTRQMTWLSEMFNLCMSTQGMAYFPNHRHNSRMNMQATPNQDYQRICQKFECPNNSLFVPFRFEEGSPRGTRIDQFSQYQCALDRRLPQALIQLERNLRTNGTICGSN